MNFNIQKIVLKSPSDLFLPPVNNAKKEQPVILTGLKIKNDSTVFSKFNTGKVPISASISIVNQETLQEKSGISNQLKSLIGINNVSTIKNSSTTKIQGIPSRSNNAITGSQFIEATKNMNRTERENMILKEIKSGNIPDFIRDLKQIDISITDNKGVKHNAKISVAPDYLAIGSNEDFVRIPMNPITAQKIADKANMSLPTKKIVDDIYKSADAKMSPQPLPASSSMMSNEYYKKHNQMVESQIETKGFNKNQLVAGHQKDIVVTNRLDNKPTQVAIYGWHQNNGKPIQPLSTVHENTYADYSHGVRLISNTVIVDGQKMDLKDVLADPELSKLFSDEGVINNSRASR